MLKLLSKVWAETKDFCSKFLRPINLKAINLQPPSTSKAQSKQNCEIEWININNKKEYMNIWYRIEFVTFKF